MENSGSLNVRSAQLVIDQLVQQGVRDFCLSPGSRSTPLALAIAHHPDVTARVHFDERGAAFHALGIAKASNKPTAILVTSGTAVGNLFPAIMEASLAQIPLIVLTADRPPELKDNGSNQTADQVKFFGGYVRWQVDLPCPTREMSDAYIGTTIAHAIFRCKHAPKGPVQLNCMFREPLQTNTAILTPHLHSTSYAESERVASTSTLETWAKFFCAEEKGVIIIGHLALSQDLSAIQDLGERLQWPIFADLLSGMREHRTGQNVIPYYDWILKTRTDLQARTILHFGDRLISKTLIEWLSTCSPTHYFLVADHPNRHDPKHQVTHRLICNPTVFSKQMLSWIGMRSSSGWVDMWRSQAECVAAELRKMFFTMDSLTEPGLAFSLASTLTKRWALFVANSMPVRDADLFFFPSQESSPVFANRGVSGIDGNIATAAGVAEGLKKPTLAVLGDLAFLHDLNSLALVKRAKYPVILLVINNDGGGIFSFLPVSSETAVFEEFFAAPHGLTFEKAAELFGLPYKLLQDIDDLQQILTTGVSCVVEMTTNRVENHHLHRQITEQLCCVMQASATSTILC